MCRRDRQPLRGWLLPFLSKHWLASTAETACLSGALSFLEARTRSELLLQIPLPFGTIAHALKSRPPLPPPTPLLMKWEYTQLRFVPRGKSWTGEIEELWLDDRQLISRSHPQRSITLVGLMNELGEQGWELMTYAQPFTGYHGGCYTFKRAKE